MTGKWEVGLTLLELFETLECDLELVLVGPLGRVVEDINAEERNDRHIDVWLCMCGCGMNEGWGVAVWWV